MSLSRGPSSLFSLSAGLTAAEPLWVTHKCWFDPIPASWVGLWRIWRAETKSPGSAPHLALGKQTLGFWSKALISSETVSGFPPCCWEGHEARPTAADQQGQKSRGLWGPFLTLAPEPGCLATLASRHPSLSGCSASASPAPWLLPPTSGLGMVPEPSSGAREWNETAMILASASEEAIFPGTQLPILPSRPTSSVKPSHCILSSPLSYKPNLTYLGVPRRPGLGLLPAPGIASDTQGEPDRCLCNVRFWE